MLIGLLFCVPTMCPSLCRLTSPISALSSLSCSPSHTAYTGLLFNPSIPNILHKDNTSNLIVDYHFCLFACLLLHCRPLGDDVCPGIFIAGSARPVPTQCSDPRRQRPLAAELSPGRQEVAALHSPAQPAPLHPHGRARYRPGAADLFFLLLQGYVTRTLADCSNPILSNH